MTIYDIFFFAFMAFSYIFSACKIDLVIPHNYDGAAFTANTTWEFEIRTQLKVLADERKKA